MLFVFRLHIRTTLLRAIAMFGSTLLLAAGNALPLKANPVLLFEPASGRVLYAEDPDRLWHPASVTKLMTLYLAFEAAKTGAVAWDADVPLSEHARAQPATRIGLRGGIKITLEQAVRGLVLRSANDFATAIAERVGGTEEKFVEAMNATAKRLGMTRTVFRNPHGLPDEEQVTTARELAILTTALLKDFPDRAEVFSTPTVVIHKGTFYSQNDLLRSLPGADGMKTGFTCASGYNVVASATRDGHRVVAIVLGALNRDKRSQRATELIEAGFSFLATEHPENAEILTAGHHTPTHAAHGPDKDAQPIAIHPVGLAELAVSPVDPAGADDMARRLRNGKCGGSGFPKKPAEPVTAEAEAPAAGIVTGSVKPVHAAPKAHRVTVKSLAGAAQASTASHVRVLKPKPAAAQATSRAKKAVPAAHADTAQGDGN
ncbi:MAG: serine hydrolase [Proteobacteria bacterium]|nr:serine hydrolase [Pseudomonadota bacterium]